MKKYRIKLMVAILFAIILSVIIFVIIDCKSNNEPYILRKFDLNNEYGLRLEDVHEIVQDFNHEFERVKLYNGEFALLLKDNKSGWKLNEGETITLSFSNNSQRRLMIGTVIDKVLYYENCIDEKSDTINYKYTAAKSEELALFILNISSDEANITNIHVE